MDNARFCPNCGTEQDNIPAIKRAAVKWMVLTGVCTFFLFVASGIPAVEISALFQWALYSLAGLHNLIGTIVLFSCVAVVVSLLTKRYEVITIIGNGYVLFFILIFAIYQTLQAIYKYVFIYSAPGIWIFLFFAVCLSILGAKCGLSSNIGGYNEFFEEWKWQSKKYVVLFGYAVSGVKLSTLLAVTMTYLVITSDLWSK